MIKLQANLIFPGCAMGKYIVKAKGFLFAVLRWGDAEGPWPDWSPIAYVPIDPAGNGEFFFPGRRAIPREAAYVWARCVSHDFSHFEDACAAIPERFLPEEGEQAAAQRFSVLTDLHLASKPWMIRRALRAAQSDTILLLGDSVNDGLPEQFEAFLVCVEAAAPEKMILPVPGNHDVTQPKLTTTDADGAAAYQAFQEKLLRNAEARGFSFERDPDSLAWSTRIGPLDLIGLQCVVSGRRFLFPEGRQLDWLERRLTENADADQHIILCHAPLLKHNPNRNEGQAYLDKNRRLQELLDRNGKILFLSGHTHVSPNVIQGNGERDEKTGNIYLDCGSVVATDTGGEEGLMAPDWKDGCRTELTITKDSVEICMCSIESEIKYPRAYYSFSARTNER